MGKYDIPASINYVLRVTQHPKLIYIGHSLGCGLFYIAMNERPELNNRVETMVALAPASSLANLRTFRELATIFNPVQVSSTSDRCWISKWNPLLRGRIFSEQLEFDLCCPTKEVLHESSASFVNKETWQLPGAEIWCSTSLVIIPKALKSLVKVAFLVNL